ncbi:unnamed protein product [Polarella glacialis]|uniref:Bet v I/Major latex protein domain-containing protein n=1 Tax=Polarella glacialis TaxID=89957 RepID=A0A813IJ72_POLGL|nr:unnamed protein product [Polarella glacialis]CAE8650254.1 unnamed protein product [Polarella glacialis]
MAPNAGYVLESAVIPADLNAVWNLIKPMTFKFSKSISQAKREEGEEVGSLGQFTVAYADNTVQTLRITEISERLPTKRSIGMEFVSSDPAVTYSSRMDQIIISSVTHGNSPGVFIEYSSDFSSDVSNAVLEDNKYKKREFFDDLMAFCGSAEPSAKKQKA